MKRVLIIGASGFVGTALLKEITKVKNLEIVCMFRCETKHELPKKIKIIYADISKKEDVIKASKKIDIVINLAVPNTQNYEINKKIIIDGTKNLIEAVRKNKIKKIIAFSTFAAYRKNLDNYGKTKLKADKLLLKSKLHPIILRPTMIYGRGGYAFEKLISSVEKVPLIVPIIGNGKYKIQPAYVGDVVEAILSAINLNNKKSLVLDIGGPYPIEYGDFIKKILSIKNRKKILLHIPLKPLILLAKVLKIFFKNATWNDMTLKRMVEEVPLDIRKTEKNLKMKFTDYEDGLRERNKIELK